MNLIFFEGQMGNGKTLGMSIVAKDWAQRSGATLYSNYGLEGSKPFRSFEDFKDVAVQPSSIVCLDEIHNDIDSRDFNTNAVKYFSHIVFYLRKLRCILMMTSPLFENIESRVRNVTNVVVSVQKDKTYYYYPFYDLQQMKSLKMKKIKKQSAHDAAQQIFDTFEMVTPLEYPANRDDFKRLLNDLKEHNKHYLLSETKESLPKRLGVV
jgi:ATPase family associated with various cellular activities (AAA)